MLHLLCYHCSTSGYFSNGFHFWRRGFYITSKALRLTPENPKWMPLAPGRNGSLYFVQRPIRSSPETPAAQGLAGERGRGVQSGHPLGFRHPLMASVKACMQVYWLNWIQCKKMKMLVALDLSKTTLQLTEALRLNFKCCILDLVNCERQLGT